MWIILFFICHVDLLVLARPGDRTVLPNTFSNHNHVGCFSTTSSSKLPLFNDLDKCVRNCTKIVTESDDALSCTHSCNPDGPNLVGVQYSKSKRSPLFFCFCGNEAKLRLLEEPSVCQCCPTDNRFCGGDHAISVYNISVSLQTEKHNWYQENGGLSNTIAEAPPSESNISIAMTENTELPVDQESVTDVSVEVELTADPQDNIELSTYATTSTRSITGQDSVTDLDSLGPLDSEIDVDVDDYEYSSENGRNDDSAEPAYYADSSEIDGETTETVSELQSSQGSLWELWVIVVVSGLCILTVGGVIILVSVLRSKLRQRELYV